MKRSSSSPSDGPPRGRGPGGRGERRGARGDLRVDAGELVDGGGDA